MKTLSSHINESLQTINESVKKLSDKEIDDLASYANDKGDDDFKRKKLTTSVDADRMVSKCIFYWNNNADTKLTSSQRDNVKAYATQVFDKNQWIDGSIIDAIITQYS